MVTETSCEDLAHQVELLQDELNRTRERLNRRAPAHHDTCLELFDRLDQLVMIIDRDFRVTGASQRTHDLVGLSGGQLVGRKCHEIFHNSPKPPKACPARTLFETGASQICEQEIQALNKIFLVSCAPAQTRDGQVESILHIATDVTPQKRMERSLKESERKLRKLFDASPIWMVLMTLEDGCYVEVNQAFCDSTGYSREEVIGRRFTDIGLWPNPEDRSEVVRIIRQEGKLIAHPIRFRMKNGEMRNFLWSAERIEMDGQEYTVNGLVDVTDRLHSEMALRESEENYRVLAENMHDVVWSFDFDGNLLYVSPSVERLRGYTPDEVLRQPLGEILTEASAAQYAAAIREFKDQVRSGGDQGGPIALELEMTHKSGGTVWIEVIINKIFNDDGTFKFFLGVARDMTERKNEQAQCQKLEAQLYRIQKMEAIGILSGGIAHDFNNILSSIIGFSELALEDARMGIRCEENIQEVLAAGQRAKALVRQILTFSRQCEEVQMPIRASSVIKETLKMIRSTLPALISIQQEIVSENLILANPTQLHRIVLNLCTNAAQAMGDGEGSLTVRLSDQLLDDQAIQAFNDLAPGEYIALSVSDTGSGMPADILDTIFEPYFTTKSPGDGTGLGLAVVHGIVKKLKGEIVVKSILGEGSTFTILLPSLPRTETPAPADPKLLPRGNERILFVDDEKGICRSNSQLLKRHGYQVTALEDPIEALRLLGQAPHRFDLLITDMTMPQMPGDVLVRSVLKIRPDLPVILCSGFSQRITAQEALKVGAGAFLMKPIDRFELISTVAGLLKKRPSDADSN